MAKFYNNCNTEIDILNTRDYAKLDFVAYFLGIFTITTSRCSELGLWIGTKRLVNIQSRTDFMNAMNCNYPASLIKCLFYQP